MAFFGNVARCIVFQLVRRSLASWCCLYKLSVANLYKWHKPIPTSVTVQYSSKHASKQEMEREESEVRLPLWCRVHSDCRGRAWGTDCRGRARTTDCRVSCNS